MDLLFMLAETMRCRDDKLQELKHYEPMLNPQYNPTIVILMDVALDLLEQVEWVEG